MESTNRRNVVDSNPPQPTTGREMRTPPNGLGYNIAAVLAAIPNMAWAALIILIFSLLIGLIWKNSLPGFLAGLSDWILWGVRIGAGLLLIKGLWKAYKAFHQLQLDSEARKTARVNTQKQYLALEERELKIEHLRVQIEAERQHTALQAQLPSIMMMVIQNGNGFEWEQKRFKVQGLPPTVVSEAPQGLLPPGDKSAAKPAVEDLALLVERNSLEVAFGQSIKEAIGTPIIIELLDCHIKIIGASRRGKSCLAAAIIDLISRTHDPNVFSIAILDLENKTGKLFASLPHIATVQLGGKKTRLHARSAREVYAHLRVIRDLMDYRYTLPEKEQERLPHLLVYIEEFLSLKSHRTLEKQEKNCLIDDLNELAIRGLKAHIHLMCCAQVDYADEDLQAFANNFALNISFSVRPQAAQAAGFMRYDLLKENYQSKTQGQFVIEGPGVNDLCIAPDYDVKARLKALAEQSEELPADMEDQDFAEDEIVEDGEEAGQPTRTRITEDLAGRDFPKASPVQQNANAPRRATLNDAIEVWNAFNGNIGRPTLMEELKKKGLDCSDDLAKRLIRGIRHEIEKQQMGNPGVGGEGE